MRDVSRRSQPLSRRRLASVGLATWLVASLLVGAPSPALGAKPNGLAAAEFLGSRHEGSGADFSVLYERTAQVEPTGEKLWVGKLVDRRTGNVEVVYRDKAGALGGPDLFRGREEAASARLTPVERKASKALRDAVARAPGLATAGADDRPALAVAVWLAVDVDGAEAAVMSRHPEVTWVGGRPVTNDLAQLRRLRAELWSARSDTFAAAAAAFEAEVTSVGGSIAYASTSAPLVFLDLPATSVAALAEGDTVISMGLEGAWSPAMTAAGPAVEADWTSGAGDAGSGVRVAVVEYHNVRPTGDLAGKVAASWAAGGPAVYTPAGTFDHPSWVAGAIAGQSATYRGVAPGAVIVSAGTGGYTPSLTYDRRIIAAADWAVSPGGGDADIVNTSLVQDTATGAEEARRFFDAISYLDGRLPISAAGNYVNFNGWQIGSPGTGYNVMTVGGVDDKGTTTRTDDRLWYVPGSNGSNWLDRPTDSWNSHGDYNKPNLVAPAVGVRTANGLAASGTSVATPIVAGIAAQLLANEPSLAVWPEATRAILMAGAVHRVPMPDGSYNLDHEGVGMASALWTNRVANLGDGPDGGYRLGALNQGDRVVQSISVRPGDRLRVALAWSSHATSSTAADTLTADLDLRVTTPNGMVVGSYTLDNAHEFVEVPISVGGTATLEILQTRFDAAAEPYGLAWAKVGDRTAPSAFAVQPQGQEPWVLPSTRPQVIFSEPVAGVDGDSLTLRVAGSSQDLPATVSYDPSSRTATLRPAAPLAPGSYVLLLGAGIADGSSNALAPTSWGFTVRAATSRFGTVLPPGTPISFNAGTYVGYQFDAAARVTAAKAAYLGKSSSASVDYRATLPGVPGIWLRVTSGIWAGYWIRESATAHLAGERSSQSFSTAQQMIVQAGSHRGYRFDAAGRVVGSKAGALASASSASVTGRAVINGSWHLYVASGIWAGYWLAESSVVYLPGARDLHDISGASLIFAAGTYTGRLFTAGGGVLSTRTNGLVGGSGAPVTGWAVINGQSSFYVVAGMWAGHWVPESAGTHIP